MSQEVADLRSRQIDTEQLLSNSSANARSAISQLATEQDETRKLKITVKGAEAGRDALRETIKQMKAEKASYAQINEEQRDQILAFESTKSQLEEKIHQEQDKQTRLDCWLRAYNQVANPLQQGQKDEITQLEARLKAVTELESSARTGVSELEAKITDMQNKQSQSNHNSNQALGKVCDERDGLQETLAEVESKCGILESEKETWMAKTDDLLNKLEQSKGEVESLRQQNGDLETRAIDSEEEVKTLTANFSQQTSLLSNANANAKSAISKLEAEQNEHRRIQIVLTGTEKGRDALRKSLTEAKSTINDLNTKLDEINRLKNEESAKTHAVTTKLESTEQRYTNLQTQHSGLRSTSSKRMSGLEDAIVQAEGEQSQLDRAWQSRYDNFEKESKQKVDDWQKTNADNHANEIDTLNSKLATAKEDGDKSTKETADLTGGIEELSKEIAELNGKVVAGTRHINAYKDDVEVLEKKLTEQAELIED
ncbi:hypothetical protein BT63DRAFT_443158 [Microthyrium microscopicum]|uniref:Uncharacterized protein n=1 Tax=Microthyrium microscopicum TaxID=703497 RepID=A0A6A6U1Q8_9PEZI|nr:hypothetical protein BT63DRAFT_443158 [Microthyrium microscopicum]